MSGTLPAIHVYGISHASVDAVRHVSDVINRQLARIGYEVDSHWRTFSAASLRGTLHEHVDLLREVSGTEGGVVIVHYTPVAFGYRGIPGPAVFVTLAALRRRRRPILVLHELAVPWRLTEGTVAARLRRRLVSTPLQWCALAMLLAGAHVIVTNEQRTKRLKKVKLQRCVVMRFIPPTHPPVSDPAPCRAGVVILGWHHAGYHRDAVLNAIASAEGDYAFTLLGGPSPGSDAAMRWKSGAIMRGLGDRVTVLGRVEDDRFRDELSKHRLAVIAYQDGLDGRRTALANALSHRLPVIGVDGKDTSSELRRSGAVELVASDGPAIGRAINRLYSDGHDRATLLSRADLFFHSHMRVDSFVSGIQELLDDD